MSIMIKRKARLCCALNASIGHILHVKEMGEQVNYMLKKHSFAICVKCGYLGWANQRKIMRLNEGV